MKTPKNYRLGDETLKYINWLAGRQGISGTEVIERAVGKVYEEEFGRLRLKARLRNDGLYDLAVEGQVVATVNEAVLNRSGSYGRQMLGEGAPADAIGVVFLSAGLVKEAYLQMNPDGMMAVYGGAEA